MRKASLTVPKLLRLADQSERLFTRMANHDVFAENVDKGRKWFGIFRLGENNPIINGFHV